MSQPLPFAINPELDLVLERFLDVPPSLVWEAWTKPEHLVHWFTPIPGRPSPARSTSAQAGRSRPRCARPKGWIIRAKGVFSK